MQPTFTLETNEFIGLLRSQMRGYLVRVSTPFLEATLKTDITQQGWRLSNSHIDGSPFPGLLSLYTVALPGDKVQLRQRYTGNVVVGG